VEFNILLDDPTNLAQNTAFLEFATPQGLAAAVANSPHTVGGETVSVEERRSRPGAPRGGRSGFTRGNGTTGRGGGRGNLQQRQPGHSPKDQSALINSEETMRRNIENCMKLSREKVEQLYDPNGRGWQRIVRRSSFEGEIELFLQWAEAASSLFQGGRSSHLSNVTRQNVAAGLSMFNNALERFELHEDLLVPETEDSLCDKLMSANARLEAALPTKRLNSKIRSEIRNGDEVEGNSRSPEPGIRRQTNLRTPAIARRTEGDTRIKQAPHVMTPDFAILARPSPDKLFVSHTISEDRSGDWQSEILRRLAR
jgi:hypothetical protein